MSLFFKPQNKVQKDRSALKSIDRDISQKSLPGVFSYFVIYLIAGLLVSDFQEYLMAAYLIGLGIFLIAILRAIYIFKFDDLYAKGPARWRNQFLSLTLCNAMIWSSMQIVVLQTELLSHASTMVLVYSAALCAGACLIFAPYRQFLKSYTSIIILPVVVTLCLKFELESLVLALGALGFWIFLIRESKAFNRNFWEKVENQYLLEQKLTLMNASRIEEGQRAELSETMLHTIMQLIKTPLQGVLGMLSILKDSRLNQEQQGAVDMASQSGAALISLIADLDDFARIKSGNLQLESKFFDLRRFIELQMESLGEFAHQRGRELSFLYSLDVPSRVNLDKKHVGHVIQSIVQYAVNACDDGEVVFKVTSGDNYKHSNVLLLTSIFRSEDFEYFDIQSQLQNRQLDRLEDLDAGILSLLVSSRLVQFMGGEVELTQPKIGLYKFSFWLPLQASSQQIDSFQPDKRLVNKHLLLAKLPVRAGKGLCKECENWGMMVSFAENNDELKRQILSQPDYILYNLPLTLDKAQLMTETFEVREWDLGDSKLIFYGMDRHRSFVEKYVPGAALLSKPSGRYSLHRGLLETTEEKAVDLELENASKRKLLLAEDNKVNRLVTEGILKKMGYQFDTVENGQQAVEVFQSSQYDLILMDCMMPIMDGVEATREIRQLEKQQELSHIPIIALTAKNAETEEKICLAAGMDEFLSKPTTAHELEETFRKWLR